MKTARFWYFLPLYLLTLLPVQAREYETVKGDLMNTRIYTLDNGLKIYLSVNKEEPRIQTYIAVRTGSKNDPAETTGLAHYLEHLMFKGTTHFGTNNAEAEKPLLDEIQARYDEYRLITDPELRKQKYHEIDSVSQIAAQYFIPNEYDKLMATVGAEGSNAYTSNDVTCYTEDIPSNELENWAKIQSDRFQNMVIRGFHTELEAVYEEYNIGIAQDMRKLYESLTAKMFPTHPYGTQTTIGTQDHLKNPSITNIKNYFNRWYVPNNCAICLSGDLDFDKTIDIITRYFGNWKPGADVSQPTFPEQPVFTHPVDTTVIGQEAETIWMGWRAKKAASLQNDTLNVISDLLSNGKAGLFDLDLNQEMKVQEAWAGGESMQDYSAIILGGTPKEGQTLDEVRQLMLGEIEKLKKGDFSDDLLPSVINNKKLNYFKSLDNNQARASQYVDAFINFKEWKDAVEEIDRMAKITKQDVVDFANRFFTEGYVVVYKKQGVDSTLKKIDKPAITPIPTNRDQVSQFVKDVQNAKVEPILPKFVDFKKDLVLTETKRKIPVVYKKNTSDGLFNLVFRYEFGQEEDNRYDIAADYIDYLGTEKRSATEFKQQFYKLACNYYINVGTDAISIGLNGLSENMAEALQLLEDLLRNAKPDKEAYNQFTDLVLKARQDSKQEQQECFYTLYNYAVFGPHNSRRDIMSEQQLKETDPKTLTDLLKRLATFEHSVLYYGPMTEKELSDVVTKLHKTPKTLAAVPEGKPYMEQQTPVNEVYIAPYDAKNIYMRMYHNEGKQFDINESAVTALFNEYFGAGMNGIVFQELREARGLAYNAFAYYSRPSLKGRPESYMTHIITQNDKMMDCLNQFQAIIDTLPQSEAAFKIAKEALTKQLATQRTNKFGVINAYLSAKRMGLDYDRLERVYNDLPRVTLQDIVDFEQKYMARKTNRYVILGDEKELDIQSLERIAPIKRLSLEEVFGY